MKPEAPWVEVTSHRWLTDQRVLSQKQGPHKTVTRYETTTERYVQLSCGHVQRWGDFAAQGKERKRLRCYQCQREASKSDE